MIAGRTLPLALALCGLMMVPSYALAQSNDGAEAGRRGKNQRGKARQKRRDRRSPKRRLSDAGKLVKKMDRMLKKTNKRLGKARENKDVIQINCVNEKLSTMKGLLRIGEQGLQSAEEAAGQRNKDLLNHELAKIKIAAMRVENLSLEVEGCVGETSAYLGSTVADVEVAEETRADDPAAAPQEEILTFPNVLRPPPVSGSQ